MKYGNLHKKTVSTWTDPLSLKENYFLLMDCLSSSRDVDKPVKIWTDEGNKIFGTLPSLNLSLEKVTLRDAYQMEKKAGVWTKIHFSGLQQFFRSEFRCIELVSGSENIGHLPKLTQPSYADHLQGGVQTRYHNFGALKKTNYSNPNGNLMCSGRDLYQNTGNQFHGHLKMKEATNQEDDLSGDFIKNQRKTPLLLPPIQQGLNEKPFCEFDGRTFDNIEWNTITSIERFTIKQLLWKDPKVFPVIEVAKHLYIIEGIDENFRKAIQHINDRDKIGVSVESQGLGRTARLCWLSVSTVENVFLFDILSLGDIAFTFGLKGILESKRILKIFHNSRTDSDLLYHKHSVNLVNVFDTMMADLIFLSKYVYDGSVPMHPRSLNHLLMDYLSIRHESLFFPRQRKGLSEVDTRKWSGRPLPPTLVMGAARRSLYLPALHQFSQLALDYETRQLTRQLLSVNRDAGQAVAVQRSEAPDRFIPEELLPNINALKIKKDLFNKYRHENHSTLSAHTKQSVKGYLKTFNGITAEKDRSFQAGAVSEEGTTEKVVFNNIGPIDKTVVFTKDCIRHSQRYLSEEPEFKPLKLF